MKKVIMLALAIAVAVASYGCATLTPSDGMSVVRKQPPIEHRDAAGHYR